MSGLDSARSAARFVSDHPVPGTFNVGAGACRVTVCDLSVNGAQIEHTQALRPAMKGRLAVGTLEAHATVVWTRMIVPGRYRSGLRLDERLEVVAAAIRGLLASGAIRKIEDTQRRRDEARVERAISRARLALATGPPPALPAGAAQAIDAARQWLATHPDEAVKWYQRARRTASDTQLRIAGGGRLNREDVLAVWEYLERRYGLVDVVRVLDQTPRGK